MQSILVIITYYQCTYNQYMEGICCLCCAYHNFIMTTIKYADLE